jgi:hypothetical protein
MFISKSELYYLKETIKYLETRLDSERDARYKLEIKLYRLLSHFNLEIENVPSQWVIKPTRKDQP